MLVDIVKAVIPETPGSWNRSSKPGKLPGLKNYQCRAAQRTGTELMDSWSSTSTVIDKYWTFRYRGLTHRPSWQSPCERDWYRKRNILAIWILGPPYGLWLAIGVSPKDHQDGLLVKGDWHLKKKYPIYLDIRATTRALVGKLQETTGNYRKLQETGKSSKTGQGVSSISKILRS